MTDMGDEGLTRETTAEGAREEGGPEADQALEAAAEATGEIGAHATAAETTGESDPGLTPTARGPTVLTEEATAGAEERVEALAPHLPKATDHAPSRMINFNKLYPQDYAFLSDSLLLSGLVYILQISILF